MDSQKLDDDAFPAAAGPETPAPLWWRFFILLLVLLPAAAVTIIQPAGWVVVLMMVPVLLLHEFGHWLAQRLLGFRDGRLFFLPFLEAGLPDAPGPVPVLHRALALLAGPLPGLILAFVLQAALRPTLDTPTGDLVAALVLFNGANLLPLGAFDSGKLLDLLLFHRRYLAVTAALLMPAVAFLALAWAVGSWVPALVAILVLSAASLHYPAWRQGRANLPPMPADIAQLDDTQRRALHAEVSEEDPEAASAAMRQLHERATEPPTTPRGWLLLTALHVLGVLLACGAMALNVRDNEAASEALIEQFDAYREGKADWEEMIGRWRAAPRGRQERALSLLLKRPLSIPALTQISRLEKELGLPRWR